MATIGWIRIGLSADVTGLAVGLKQGQSALSRFEAAASVAGGALAGLGAGFGLAKAVEGFRSMISAASDLDENINKVKAVFGEGAASVIADSDAMARAFGNSKNQYLDAAGRFGGLFKGAGFAGEQTAKLSQQFTRLAADAASFFNVDFETAFMKLRSGLSGEAEPLRDFGVFLTEDGVKAYAYAHGIAAMGAALTDQQKIMARVAMITAGLSDANGDLARTSGGVANLARNAWGQLENLGAEVGKAFLPVVQRALSATSGFLAAMGEWARSSGVLTTLGDLIDSVIITPIEFLVGLVKAFDDGLKSMGIDLIGIFTAALKPIADMIKLIANVIKFFTYGKEAAKDMAAATAEAPKFAQRASAPTLSSLKAGGAAHHGPAFAPAALAGSREAYSAILASRGRFDAAGRLTGGGLDVQRQIARDTRATAEKSAAQVDLLKQIVRARALADPPAPTAAHLASR